MVLIDPGERIYYIVSEYEDETEDTELMTLGEAIQEFARITEGLDSHDPDVPGVVLLICHDEFLTLITRWDKEGGD